MKALQRGVRSQATAIEDMFGIIDDVIRDLGQASQGTPLTRVCCLVVAKGRNLSLGSYGLILDGLGQESGALLRLLIVRTAE